MVSQSSSNNRLDSVVQFLTLGAPRSGTTWLYELLESSQTVFVPEKEIHFFSVEHGRDLFEENGLSWYLAKFAGTASGQVAGEVAVGYLRSKLARDRIHRTLPDAKLVVVLRNPVDRMWSAYQYLKGRGAVVGGFEEFACDRGLGRKALLDGLYYDQLSAWLELFPREQLKVVLFEDIRDKPAVVASELFEFLGAAVNYDESLLNKKVNAPTWTRSRVFSKAYFEIAHLLSRRGLDPIKRTLRSTGLPRFLLRLNKKKLEKKEFMSRAMRSKLSDYYSNDIRSLEKLLEQSLEHWVD